MWHHDNSGRNGHESTNAIKIASIAQNGNICDIIRGFCGKERIL
jgi:hypothetical protein